jgi:nucleoside-diphosphate-sugar epimerase
MKLIIIGGTGLLGNALAKDLIQFSHKVIALTRNHPHVKDVKTGVQLVEWDGRTTQGWDSLINGAFANVNLTGENLSAYLCLGILLILGAAAFAIRGLNPARPIDEAMAAMTSTDSHNLPPGATGANCSSYPGFSGK